MTEVDTRSTELYCARSCHHHVLTLFEAIQRVLHKCYQMSGAKLEFMNDIGANVSGCVLALHCNEDNTECLL